MPKFNRSEIEQYYNILGLDPNEEGLIVRDSINLAFIGDLYELNEFDRKLSYTAKDLSNSYTLLYQMIRDGFWYETKKRRENALTSALEIVEDLTNFDIEVKDNPELTTDRMNNLKTTIIKGLCSCGDLITFRMYQKNSSFQALFSKITDIENEENCKDKLGYEMDKTPEELMKLYYLIAYSKFNNEGSDFEMFDGTGKITLPNIRHLVKRSVRENVSIKDNYFERETIDNPKILRLSHFRKKEE